MNISGVYNSPVALQYSTVGKAFESSLDDVVKVLGWNIPPEHSDLVHPHWRIYQEPHIAAHVGVSIIYFFLMCTSTLGNGLVLYGYIACKALRTPSNLFVANQAVFNLCMMTNMPLLIVNSLYRRPLGWQLGCDIYAFFGSVSGMGSSINNAAIAYDRYRTIAFPLDGRLSFKQAIMLVVFTWLWASPFSIIPLFGTFGGRYVTEGFLTTCSFDFLTQSHETQMFVLSIFCWAYVFPLSLIIIFYYLLFGHVRQHEKMLQEQAKRMNVKSLQSNADSQQQSVEIRIAKVAFTIFFLFLCSWTPYAVVALTGAFGNRQLLTPMVTMIPAIASKVVSVIDPWIYAINHPRYRKELQQMFPTLMPQDKPSASDTTSLASERTVATCEETSA